MSGLCYERLDDVKAATLAYKKCLTLDTNYAPACFQLGNILLSQQQGERATKYFKHGLK